MSQTGAAHCRHVLRRPSRRRCPASSIGSRYGAREGAGSRRYAVARRSPVAIIVLRLTDGAGCVRLLRHDEAAGRGGRASLHRAAVHHDRPAADRPPDARRSRSDRRRSARVAVTSRYTANGRDWGNQRPHRVVILPTFEPERPESAIIARLPVRLLEGVPDDKPSVTEMRTLSDQHPHSPQTTAPAPCSNTTPPAADICPGQPRIRACVCPPTAELRPKVVIDLLDEQVGCTIVESLAPEGRFAPREGCPSVTATMRRF